MAEESTPSTNPMQSQRYQHLASFIQSRVELSRSQTESLYRDAWDHYYRLWRGVWHSADKERKSERSRLIVPALSEAIEATAGELESAFLAKADNFFDIVDTGEPDPELATLRSQLKGDMCKAKFTSALGMIILMGTLFGTGIGRLVTTTKTQRRFEPDATGYPITTEEDVPIVKLVPVLPHNFVIETGATDPDDSSFVAEYIDSLPHHVKRLMDNGTYERNPISVSPRRRSPDILGEAPQADAEVVPLIEYQGLVPQSLIDEPGPPPEGEEFDLGIDDADLDEDEGFVPRGTDYYMDEPWVEAIVTLMDGGTVIRAKRNETLSMENSYVCYRHEPVPNQFWGRGVGEKGLHPQVALDSTLRARLDSQAMTVHPMVGIDRTRLPRNFKFTISPGRTIGTQGNPADIIQPIHFGSGDISQFQDINELKNQVSMATGALDTGIQLEMQSQNGTLGGLSMVMAGFIKRSLRTIRRIETELMEPLVRKTFELYMMIDPVRYPAKNYTFKAISASGTMAREIEQTQLLNLLKTTKSDSPAYWITMKAIWEHSSVPNREEVIQVIDQQLQAALNPQPDPMVQMQMEKIKGDIMVNQQQLQVNYIRAQSEVARAANEARLAPSKEAKLQSETILALAKAEAEEIGQQMATYKAQLDSLLNNSTAEAAQAGVNANAATRQIGNPQGNYPIGG